MINLLPTRHTPRLLLRAFAPADVPHLVALAGNYEVAKNTLNIPHPYDEEDARRWPPPPQNQHSLAKIARYAAAWGHAITYLT